MLPSSDSPVVVLTGAGVSAESGVPTFRGAEGLWRSYRPEELATWRAFQRDPALVWEWYDWRRQIIADCRPNRAHETLAAMEHQLPDLVILTQNVDGLHQKAGSSRVVELHGSIWHVRCLDCQQVEEHLQVPMSQIPPRCGCGGLLRPDVVWFGENLPVQALDAATSAAWSCQLMLVIGTAAVVHPAATLPIMAKQAGARLVEMNLTDTPITPIADLALRGPAGHVLPRWWSEYLAV